MSQAENEDRQSDEERQQPEAEGSAAGGVNARGFAAMDNEKQRQIASKGGAAVSRNREYMAAIGKKGGERVSQNREHMASIGRKGGEAVSQDREHMSRIGRKGGES
jgi:general stress protein YciG